MTVGAPTTGVVLAIDTSVDVRVGLARDGVPVARAGLADSRAHAEQLMPLVDRLLTDAGVGWSDLTQVAVGLGPGPFTGLRVGMATAQTLAFALDVPWHGVCGLDVIAAEYAADSASRATELPELVVATDARRREVYWARYDAAGVRVDGPRVSRPDELPDLPVIGPGALLVREVAQPGPQWIDAALLAAQTYADAGTEPLYLRRPDAQVPGRRKSTLPRLLPPAVPR